MVRPEWDEDLGGTRASHEKPYPCQECGHSSAVHRRNGACHSSVSCLCGWSKVMDGAESVKRPVPDDGFRKRNKGARVGLGTRGHLLKIPCFFCGEKAESIDHFVARSRGGKSNRDNLVSACLVCNGMKGDKSYDELLEFCRSMETAVNRRTALRHVRTFLLWKEKAKKILAWHAKRIAAKQLPVV